MNVVDSRSRWLLPWVKGRFIVYCVRRMIRVTILFTAISQSVCVPLTFGEPVDSADQLNFMNRIKSLETELRLIREAQDQSWLNNHADSTEEIHAIINEVLHDANKRTSLLRQDGDSGYDGGYFLNSPDGIFSLEIGFQEMIRFVFNDRDTRGLGEDGDVSGFENRRTKMFFSGHVFDPKFSYRLSISLSKSSGTASLSDGYGRWDISDQIAVQAGQFKPPFLYEELMSSSKQLAADRSFVNALRTLSRSQGVMFDYQGSRLRVRTEINDGVIINPSGTNGKTVGTAFNVSTAEFALTGRVDFLAKGNWKQFKDYTSWSNDEFGLLVGAAGHWQTDAFGTSANENRFVEWTVDAAAEFGGAEIAAAIIGSYIDTNTPGMPIYNQIGGTIQGGVHIVPDKVELFARYEWFDFDGATNATTRSDFSALTMGVNWFMQGQKVKFTTDVIWAFDPVPESSANVGLLADVAGADDQLVLRSQMSLRW